ncbi:hypothetical protein [Streptomyces goshikiensis]|uniref:hypothetical protein n=1 Tax=Streptomyces goshikiensis TaxID=1942 RepID=UPI0036B4BF48
MPTFTLIATPPAGEAPTVIEMPDTIELAWAEHEEREAIERRYFAALHAGDLDMAAAVWLDAAAYDEANPGCSPLTDVLDGQPLADAA